MADDKAYKAALNSLNNLIDKQKALKKSTEDIKDSWNSVSTQLFGISGSEFFKQVPRTKKELQELNDEVAKMEEGFNSAAKEFSEIINSNSGAKIQELAKNIQNSLGNSFRSIADIQKEKFDAYAAALAANSQISNVNAEDLAKILEGTLDDQNGILDALKATNEFKAIELENSKKYAKSQAEMAENIKNLKRDNKELLNLSDQEVENMARILSESRNIVDDTIDWEKATHRLSDEHRDVLSLLEEDGDAMRKLNAAMAESADAAKGIKDKMLQPKEVMDLTKSIQAFGSKMRQDFIGSIMKFDEVLHDVQKNTGIAMVENSRKFANMTTEAAQFGMSVEQAGQMMSDMSDELNTTDFGVLSKATADFAAIEGATGASAKDITTIAGELMRMGESSSQVKDFMEGADQEARKFGVSSSKILGGVSRNIKKMREMGFTGGEKSLTKMAITAERLKMNMDETFDTAKRARTIEGAMDMAAELQLAGGSFSNINPMDLLAAARKGPEELQKILTKMGKDIGHFDTETGKMVFDPVDVDRLQMVSDATGQSMESLQNMISTNAADIEKIKPFDSMLDGLNEADAELAKSSLSQMMKMGKDGKVEFDVDSDMARKMGVDSMEELQSMSAEDLKKKMEEDAKTVEEQNRQNQSLKKSFDNFMAGLMGALNVFQPVLEMLGWVFQKFSQAFQAMPDMLKPIVGMLLVGFTLFSSSVGAFITKGIGAFLKAPMNMAKGIKGMFGGGGDGGTDVGSGAKGPGLGVGAGLKSLAEGLKSMGDKDVFKGIGAVALSGPAFLLFVPALPGLLVMGLIGAMSALVIKGFEAVALGLSYFGDTKGVMKGIGAVALAAIPLLLFTIALPGILAMAVVGALSPLVIAGFKALSMGFGMMGENLTNIAKGVLALALVAVAVGAFTFVASMMTDVDWMSVLAGVGVMALVTLGLIGLGFLLSGPGIAFLAVGALALIGVGLSLAIAGAGLMVAALAFQQLSAVNWAGFSDMGSALASVVPGLMMFSLAAMMFMNPLTLLGIMFMVGALTSLVSVMAPLAESLTLGADSLDRFASGLEKLSAAADALSLEKLEKLKELSDSMANAGAGGAAMAAMANSTGGGGGKGGDGEVRKIEVNVKMNGRDMQNFIVKDTALIK